MKFLTKFRNKIITISFMFKGADIGKKTVIYKGVDIDNPRNVIIGDHSVIYKNITMCCNQGSIKIGNHSHIASYAYLLVDKGNLKIGDFVGIGNFCCIYTYSNIYAPDTNKFFSDCYVIGDVSIGNNVMITSHCVVLPNTIVEDNVIVGAGSVVKGKLESGWLYGGIPVKKIKKIYK